MPTPAYCTIEGSSQGPITQGTFTEESVGNIYQEGHEDEILVEAFSHEVTVPTDPQSGQATGQRVHRPLVLTKVYDKCSPLLYRALCTGERLPNVEIKWYRTSTDGRQEHYFTTKLEDAIITNIAARMPNCQDPAQAHFTHLEEVSFTYRQIIWEHMISGTSESDDWRAPKV
jgi:type VI secretion system secreted protein Hcp